jgi:hypothetical protein
VTQVTDVGYLDYHSNVARGEKGVDARDIQETIVVEKKKISEFQHFLQTEARAEFILSFICKAFIEVLLCMVQQILNEERRKKSFMTFHLMW